MVRVLASHESQHRFSTMGCPASVVIEDLEPCRARQAVRAVIRECTRLDEKYSHYRDDNFLAALQSGAGSPGGTRVDTETLALFEVADQWHSVSQGRFDVSSLPLTRMWQGRKTLPTEDEIDSTRAETGWSRVHIRADRLTMPSGYSLDLGGIVKEYAADRAAWILRQHGVRSGYVDLGGDLHVVGPHPDGSPWKVGIRNPLDRDRPFALIAVSRGGLATSGDYERFSEINGRRYGHIINPRTGWPVTGQASVSVAAPSALVAGGLSTMAMLGGAEQGLAFLENSGLAWLSINSEGRVAGALSGLMAANGVQ